MIYYGKQESCTNKKESSAAFKIVETIKECYHGIKYHILLTENVNSKEIMINGDGKSSKGIQNEDKQKSKNGIMLKDLIEKYDLTVVKNKPVCKVYPWNYCWQRRML